MPRTLRTSLIRFFDPTGPDSEPNPGPGPDPYPGIRLRLFLVALAVRVAYMTLAHTYRIRTWDDHFNFGFEAGRIAQALVTGYGYADPFSNLTLRHTGPTAWLPPLYPLILAGVFKVFGVYTALSAWVILLFNCVASATIAPAVWELGLRFAGRRNALWSGWLWALYPAAMQYAVRWVWDMSLTTALFAFSLVLTLRMREAAERGEDRHTLRRWALFGLVWGLIALSNSTLVLFLPAAGLWVLAGGRGRRTLLSATFAGVLFLLVLTPWVARNWLVLHAWVPLRSNFGAELYLGNGPGSEGLLMEYEQPAQDPAQLRLYHQMGEVAYARARGAAAAAFIRNDPAHFAADTLKRFYFFWVSVPHASEPHEIGEFFRVLNYAFVSLGGLLGLALALYRRRPGAWLFFWAILLLPLTYYFVTVHARFRHPLEPILCVLAVYLFQSAQPRRVRGAQSTRSPAAVR